MSQNCGSCKFYKQIETHSVCDSPLQDNKSAKEYSYWFFGTNCKFYEKGSHESRKRLKHTFMDYNTRRRIGRWMDKKKKKKSKIK